MSGKTLLAIGIGAMPGVGVYTLGWYWWTAPFAYATGIFVGNTIARWALLRDLSPKKEGQ